MLTSAPIMWHIGPWHEFTRTVFPFCSHLSPLLLVVVMKQPSFFIFSPWSRSCNVFLFLMQWLLHPKKKKKKKIKPVDSFITYVSLQLKFIILCFITIPKRKKILISFTSSFFFFFLVGLYLSTRSLPLW